MLISLLHTRGVNDTRRWPKVPNLGCWRGRLFPTLCPRFRLESSALLTWQETVTGVVLQFAESHCLKKYYCAQRLHV